MHMMACVLDPGFKKLQFVPEEKDREQYLKDVRTNLILCSKELAEEGESIDLMTQESVHFLIKSIRRNASGPEFCNKRLDICR